MTRPLIGISCDFEENLILSDNANEPVRDRSYVKLYHYYYHALTRAGASCVLLPVCEEPERALDVLDRLDGVMLTGGDDYPAEWYQQAPHPRTGSLSPWRSEHDLTLAKHLLNKSSLPVLAICGGMQVLAIASGGSLVQHIPDAVSTTINHSASEHEVETAKGTRLANLLGKRFTVNSIHHQAVDTLGSSLKISAHSTDDHVVEACEGVDPERYLMATQWHPELMPNDNNMQKLFADFVSACRRQADMQA